jgi:hypothetical protein
MIFEGRSDIISTAFLLQTIPFKKIESERGKPVIVVEDQKFHQAFIKKNGEIRWRFTIKSCSARVFTDESISIILSGELDHIHETNEDP